MLMVLGDSAYPIGFCNEFLIGSELCAQFGFVFSLLFNFPDWQL